VLGGLVLAANLAALVFLLGCQLGACELFEGGYMFGLAGWEPDNNGPGYQPQQAVPLTYRAPADTEEPIDWGATFWAVSMLVLVAGGFAVLIIVFRRSWRVGLLLLVIAVGVFLVFSLSNALSTASTASPPSGYSSGYRETEGGQWQWYHWFLLWLLAVVTGFISLAAHRYFVTTRLKERLYYVGESGQFPVVDKTDRQGNRYLIDLNKLPLGVAAVTRNGEVQFTINGQLVDVQDVLSLAQQVADGAHRTATARAMASGNGIQRAPVGPPVPIDVGQPLPPVRIEGELTEERLARQLNGEPQETRSLPDDSVSGLLRMRSE
jgi:hypothetical protein